MTPDDLVGADEVFLSTSGGGAVPVTRVDDRIFSNDAPGPLATGIRAAYWEWMERPGLRQEVDYAVH